MISSILVHHSYANFVIPSRLTANQFEALPIQMSHVLQVAMLPDYHRGPFDRILIAQSQVEQALILSTDQAITHYPMNVVW